MAFDRYLPAWEHDPELCEWLVKAEDKNLPYCSWCDKILTPKLAHLRRHARTTLHLKKFMRKNGIITPTAKHLLKKKKHISAKNEDIAAAAAVDVTADAAVENRTSAPRQNDNKFCLICKKRLRRSRVSDLLLDRTRISRALLTITLAKIIRQPMHQIYFRHGSHVCDECVQMIDTADELESKLTAIESQIRLKFNMPYSLAMDDPPDFVKEDTDNEPGTFTGTDGERYQITFVDESPCMSPTPSVGENDDEDVPGDDEDVVTEETEETANTSPDGFLFVWHNGELVPMEQAATAPSDLENCDKIQSMNVEFDGVTVDDAMAVVTEDGHVFHEGESVNVIIADSEESLTLPIISTDAADAAIAAPKKKGYQRKKPPDFIPRYQSRDNKLTCRLCGFVANTNMVLHKHWNQFHPEKLLPCPCCDKKFFYRTSVNKHMLIHKGPTYFCELCNHPFVNRRDLQRHHTFRHSDVKPFVCMICGQGFKVKFILQRHLRVVHSIDKITADQIINI